MSPTPDLYLSDLEDSGMLVMIAALKGSLRPSLLVLEHNHRLDLSEDVEFLRTEHGCVLAAHEGRRGRRRVRGRTAKHTHGVVPHGKAAPGSGRCGGNIYAAPSEPQKRKNREFIVGGGTQPNTEPSR